LLAKTNIYPIIPLDDVNAEYGSGKATRQPTWTAKRAIYYNLSKTSQELKVIE
jgi:hypothetical protein